MMKTYAVKHIHVGALGPNGGTGGCRPSKAHLYASEAIQSGRLKRAPDTPLCGAPASFDARVLGEKDDDPHIYARCPKCKDMAARHNIPWPEGWRGERKIARWHTTRWNTRYPDYEREPDP